MIKNDRNRRESMYGEQLYQYKSGLPHNIRRASGSKKKGDFIWYVKIVKV